MTTTRQRLVIIGRVPDEWASSQRLATFRRVAVWWWWERIAELPGAIAVDDPEVATSDNMLYGCEIVGPDNHPILDRNGQSVIDQDRLIMRVSGWVDLPQDVFDSAEPEDEARRIAALSAIAERRQ